MIVNTQKPMKLSELEIDVVKYWNNYGIRDLGYIFTKQLFPFDSSNGSKIRFTAYRNGTQFDVASIANGFSDPVLSLINAQLAGNFDCNGYYLDDFAVDAGETIAAQATVEHTNNTDTYLIMAAIKMRRKMRVNVSVEAKTDTLGQTAYVALYKDGIIIAGTEQTTTEISYITLTWSGIEIADGSELQCAIHASGTGDIAYQRNFAVKVLDYADCYVSVQ